MFESFDGFTQVRKRGRTRIKGNLIELSIAAVCSAMDEVLDMNDENLNQNDRRRFSLRS